MRLMEAEKDPVLANIWNDVEALDERTSKSLDFMSRRTAELKKQFQNELQTSERRLIDRLKELAIMPDGFDQNKHQVGCLNGVVFLRERV